MKITKELSHRIIDLAKANMNQSSSGKHWSKSEPANQADMILEAYLKALNMELKTDFKMDFLEDFSYDDITNFH